MYTPHIRTSVVHVFWLTLLSLFVVAILTLLSPYGAKDVYAQSEIDRLKAQIDERNNRLLEIEKEIANYQAELKKVGGEKKTLQSAISQLELERKKVQSDISYTQNRIGAKDLEIERLSYEIRETQGSITMNEEAIAETLRRLNEVDNDSMIEVLLQYENLSDFWSNIENLEQVRAFMNNKVKSLVSEKILLEQKKNESTSKRQELVKLKNQYSDQNLVLTNTKAEKNSLLKATQSEEAAYQKMLKEREAARELIIKELRAFESELQFILDPNTVPPRGTPVFDWPLKNIVITQLFGGTEFAKQNAGVYGGRAYHPGVDFGAPRGTKIYAPLGGVVRATGDTDVVAGCYSWGKWTLLDHSNGLSTLYAHQSVISVVPGQSVSTGDVIGYTGNTGYSTGPHLHFTVYAKAGVSVRKFNEIKTVTSCGSASTPIAAADAYIDPLVYLPAQ